VREQNPFVVPPFRRKIIPGAGHYLTMVQPQPVAEKAIQFLSESVVVISK